MLEFSISAIFTILGFVLYTQFNLDLSSIGLLFDVFGFSFIALEWKKSLISPNLAHKKEIVNQLKSIENDLENIARGVESYFDPIDDRYSGGFSSYRSQAKQKLIALERLNSQTPKEYYIKYRTSYFNCSVLLIITGFVLQFFDSLQTT